MYVFETTAHFANKGANPDIRPIPIQVSKSGGKTPKYEIAKEAAAIPMAPAKPNIKISNRRKPAGK